MLSLIRHLKTQGRKPIDTHQFLKAGETIRSLYFTTLYFCTPSEWVEDMITQEEESKKENKIAQSISRVLKSNIGIPSNAIPNIQPSMNDIYQYPRALCLFRKSSVNNPLLHCIYSHFSIILEAIIDITAVSFERRHQDLS
jgi:hypothetical protein